MTEILFKILVYGYLVIFHLGLVLLFLIIATILSLAWGFLIGEES